MSTYTRKLTSILKQIQKENKTINELKAYQGPRLKGSAAKAVEKLAEEIHALCAESLVSTIENNLKKIESVIQEVEAVLPKSRDKVSYNPAVAVMAYLEDNELTRELLEVKGTLIDMIDVHLVDKYNEKTVT